MSPQALTRSAELSLHLHSATLPYLRSDWPRAQSIIRENLALQRGLVRSTLAHGWLDQWETAAAEGVEAVVRVAMMGGDRGDDLRQVSPLAGVLPNDERLRILEKVRSAAR